MAILKLFGQEAMNMTANVTAVAEPKVKRTPTPRKPKEETITDLRYKQEKELERLRELESQDETGWSDFDKSIRGKEVNSALVKAHICYYQKQIEQLQEPHNLLLNKWKSFIVNLCKERGQAIDKIWFDVSSPYDCEIAVRLAGHRCWSACVEFRFDKEHLRAFDSHFGGGTSMVGNFQAEKRTDEETGRIITGIMEKVFNKECTDSSWEDRGDRTIPHRVIIVAENGWRAVVDKETYMSESEKEDRAEMLAEVNAVGFIQNGENYVYWTHYGKKEGNINSFEALLNDSFYGLIAKNISKEVVCGENQNADTNTWIITKEFFEHLKANPMFKKVEGKARWNKI